MVNQLMYESMANCKRAHVERELAAADLRRVAKAARPSAAASQCGVMAAGLPVVASATGAWRALTRGFAVVAGRRQPA